MNHKKIKYIHVLQCRKVKMQKETNEDKPSFMIWHSYDLRSPNPYQQLTISGLSDMSGNTHPHLFQLFLDIFCPLIRVCSSNREGPDVL